MRKRGANFEEGYGGKMEELHYQGKVGEKFPRETLESEIQ